ncbi:P-type conjugative transfer protein TrbL [Deltaproteobacteria bacterium Smac51]|nr:P-type conjugative transfer protein TrbL [Deltaproteobacteria bacterium Smac51]
MRKLPIFIALTLLICLSAETALAQDNIAKGLLERFVSQTDGWWAILRGYALFLFTTTLILEICLFGIRVAIQQTNIAETFGQFVMLLLFAGFIAAVIMNYQEWSTGIAIKGLQPLTGQLTGNAVDAGQPLAMAAAVVDKILPVMKDAGITDFGEVYLYVSCMLIILVIFVLISALVILVTCEFYIVANIGVLLIGLGGSKIFKDYAINVMRYVLATAVKLFVLQLIVNIGFAIISLSDLDASVGTTVKSIKFVDLFFLIGKAVILLALAKSLPDTCAGIINGSAIGGGNPIASMARTAGVMAMGTVTAGAGYAVGAAKATNAAHTIAQENGAVGAAQTVKGMARAAWQARGDAKAGEAAKNLETTPGSIKNQLISGANAAKAMRLLDDDGGQPAPPSDTADSAGGSGQAVQSGSSPYRPEQPAAQPTPSGGAGDAAPSVATPDGAAPQASSQPEASSASPAGGSGQPVPENPSSNHEATVSPSVPPKPSKEDYGPPTRPKGTIDMRTFDPSTLKK